MFLVWQNRPWGDPMSCTGCVVSFLAIGMEGGEGGERIHYDLSQCGSGASPGGKRRLIRGGGSAAQTSNGTGPQDPGAGEARLTTSRYPAVTRPVFQPKPRSVIERSDEVGVYAVVVEATGRWVDCTGSTVSDKMLVVPEDRNGMDGLCWGGYRRGDVPSRFCG